MSRKLAVIAAFVVAFATLPVAAQEELPQAKKFESPEWFFIVHVQFESGEAEKALELIKKHFTPPAEVSGLTMPKIFRCHTGEWDAVMLFRLADGISQMEWEISPMDVKWFAALAEQEGGMEAAQKIYSEYEGMIEDWDVELVRWIDMAPSQETPSD